MPSVPAFSGLPTLVPKIDDCTDAELVQRFSNQRDELAFTEIVRRHGPMVYGTCRRILNHGSDADDAFQATFFVLARKAGQIRDARALGAWIHSVAMKVARKAQQQAINRRVRQMAAAKPEAVQPATPVGDLWAVIDDELNKLPVHLRQAIIACDISGKSRSQAAQQLGWPEGTVAKRLAKARQELARQLTQRGVTLGVAGLAAGWAAEACSAIPSRLVTETISQAPAFALRTEVGSIVVRTLAEEVMRSMKTNWVRLWILAGLAAIMLAGGGIMLAGGPLEPPQKKPEPPKASFQTQASNVDNSVWKEKDRIEFPGWLPASVVYSPDGKLMVVGGTGGKVAAYDASTLKEKWTADAGGNFAAVAVSADRKSILATIKTGVQYIDLESGKLGNTIEESDPSIQGRITAVGAFPDRTIENGMQKFVSHKIMFGTPGAYIVKTWIETAAPGRLKISTTGTGNKPADKNAVPLAVDPAGSSAIITGPIDPKTGKNILWAYVAGNNDPKSPGNRIMPGHEATVVSAAWSKDGKTAVTGDAAGRVIVWNAQEMRETSRMELGARIAAVAVTADGKSIAAAAVGKQAKYYVWETTKAAKNIKPICIDNYDYQKSVFACLGFSPDGKQLAGSAFDEVWLSRLGELVGKLHVWETVTAKSE